MPYDVKEERRADSLTRGARVVKLDPNDQEAIWTVERSERKVKYVYLDLKSVDTGALLENVKFVVDEKLIVLREKLTVDEQFDLDTESAQNWTRRELDKRMAETPAAYLFEQATKWQESPYGGHVLDWSESTTFYKLQAEYKVWREIWRKYVTIAGMFGAENVTPLSALVATLYERETSDRGMSPVDPTSRSTNLFSSVIDDLDRWAWDKLRDSIKWYIHQRVYDLEVERLLALAEAREADRPK